jgi:mycothione reductase
VPHFDLCIIGSGSANTIPGRRLASWRIAMVEGGTFGGTCLNVGCIPSKMYVYPADHPHARAADGLMSILIGVGALAADRDRIGRYPVSQGRAVRVRDPTRYRETSPFVGPKAPMSARAPSPPTGSSSPQPGSMPDIPGLTPRHTSDTVMRLSKLPESMIIIGGGYVAAEFAHVFSAFGTAVTIINRSSLLLRREDREISAAFTKLFGRQVRLLAESKINYVSQIPGGPVSVSLLSEGEQYTISGEVLLVATGRIPNGDTLNLAAPG